MMIQQHDGVVVDAAELRQGFAKQLREEEEVLQGGGRGSRTLDSWRLPLPCYTSPSRRRTAKPCCGDCCIHHHAVVLLDLHQLLLPPCWIKKEETSLQTVRVLNAEVPSVRC